jgi:hypothetical protein
MKDSQELDVERILDISGLEGKSRSGIRVKVRWTSCGAKYGSRVPWKEINQNTVFHGYPRKNRLSRLLPEGAKEVK